MNNFAMRLKAEIENGRERGALAFRVTFGYGKDTVKYYIIWILFDYIFFRIKKALFILFKILWGACPPGQNGTLHISKVRITRGGVGVGVRYGGGGWSGGWEGGW